MFLQYFNEYSFIESVAHSHINNITIIFGIEFIIHHSILSYGTPGSYIVNIGAAVYVPIISFHYLFRITNMFSFKYS